MVMSMKLEKFFDDRSVASAVGVATEPSLRNRVAGLSSLRIRQNCYRATLSSMYDCIYKTVQNATKKNTRGH